MCAVHPRAADIDVGEALADIARLEAAAWAVVDPERGAAAVACASWLALVLRPAVLEAAGWRRREGSHDAWVDPCAPEDLHDEASALHRVRKDLAA